MSDVDPTDGGIHSGDPTSGSSLPGQDELRGWGFKWIQSLIGQVVKAIVGVLLPGNTFDQLSNWANVLLPEQIRAPIGQLVELLIAGLNLIPIFGPLAGDAVEYLAGIFGLLDDNTTSAQGSANVANTGVARLDAQLASIIAPPGGVYLNDNFDRTGSDLGSSWFWEYSGPGGGSLGTDGNNAVWTPAGGDWRRIHAIHTTPLATNDQMCSLVNDTVSSGTNFPPDLRLILRSDATLDNCVVAIITRDYTASTSTIEIGYVVSGTYTRLGSTETITHATGDRWKFLAGTSAATDPDAVGDERQFLLYLNDGLVCNRTDSGDVSQMGAGYLQAGFGGTAGVFVAFIPFPVAFQSPMTPVQGWAAADRAA